MGKCTGTFAVRSTPLHPVPRFARGGFLWMGLMLRPPHLRWANALVRLLCAAPEGATARSAVSPSMERAKQGRRGSELLTAGATLGLLECTFFDAICLICSIVGATNGHFYEAHPSKARSPSVRFPFQGKLSPEG